MHRTPFRALRQKFVNDLEDILECPVCLGRFSEPVWQCLSGHSICQDCCYHLPTKKCPICKHKYYGTRNFLAEDLINKFDEIKTSLIDPTNNINQTTAKNKMCIGIQTSPMAKSEAHHQASPIANQSNQTSTAGGAAEIVTKRLTRAALRNLIKEIDQKENKEQSSQMEDSTEMVQQPAIIMVNPGRGRHSCLIGNCGERLTHRFMIAHLKELHSTFFFDAGIVEGSEYTTKWKIQYKPKSIFDRAVYIQNMGLFFVKVVISAEGEVHAYPVVLNNSMEKVKPFKYRLSVGKKDTYFSLETSVLPNLKDLKRETTESLFISRAQLTAIMKKGRSLNYILKITHNSI